MSNINLRNFLILLLSIGLIIPYVEFFYFISIFNLISIFLSIVCILLLLLNRLGFNRLLFTIIFLNIILFFFTIAKTSIYVSLKHFFLPITVLLGIYWAISLKRNLWLFLDSVLILISIESIIAFFQLLGLDFAWELRFYFGIPEEQLLQDQFLSGNRPMGLAYYAVQFSYQLAFAVPILFLRFISHNNTRNEKLTNISLFIIIFIGILSCKSISVLVVFFYCFFSFLSISRWNNRLKLNVKHLFLFVLIICIILLQNHDLFDRVISITNDASANSRFFLLYMGALAIIKQPFGMNENDLYIIKGGVINQFGLSDYFYELSFHNSFLNVGVKHGIHIMAIYIIIFYFFISKSKNLLEKYKTNRLHYEYFFFIKLGLNSYLIQTLTHNAGLNSGDLYGWLWIALSIRIFNMKFENSFHKFNIY